MMRRCAPPAPCSSCCELYSSLRDPGFEPAELMLENLALRQQLALFHQRTPHPPISSIDRAFWSCLSQVWPRWRRVLLIVKPETVVRWHRRGFRLFWKWKSRVPFGRPQGRGPAPPHRRNGSRQPELGRAEDPRRVAKARILRGPIHRRPVYAGPFSTPTLSDLAHVPR